MMIGCAGATFVTNQFWCSLMFAPNVVGTANATAAGWGNLGGGVTQIFIVWCLFKPFKAAGANANVAWRLSMVVPGVIFVLIALGMKLICWDTPTNRRFKTSDTGKTSKASLWDYVECLKDIRIDIMILQYGACFGTELAMNAQLATHFRVYFQMEAGAASVLAGCFGQMTEGTSYGIVPFMNPKQLACTSALVGAGGNLGAVIALWCFYKPLGPIDTLLPFKIHGLYVIFWALTSPAFYWKDKGGMFWQPADPAFQKPGANDAKGIVESSTV